MDLTPAALAAQASDLACHRPCCPDDVQRIAAALGAVCDAARAERADEVAALKEKLAAINVLREQVMGTLTIVNIMDRRLEKAEAAVAGRAEEVRQLREALALLLLPIRQIVHDEPPERMIPTQHCVSNVRQARTAYAATEPSHG